MTPARETPPPFARLPVRPDAPPESSWGVFGDGDDLGTLNHLTGDEVVAAARLVRAGRVFRLDLPLHVPGRPAGTGGRGPIQHTLVSSTRSATALGDRLDNFDTQVSTQWDGLKHHRHPDHGYYNGVSAERVMTTADGDGALGIQRWADRLVGRGVLLDVEGHRDAGGRATDHDDPEPITHTELEASARAQEVEIRPGDILLLRTGAMRHYLDTCAAAGENLDLPPASVGLLPGREIAEWLWDQRVAAVAADNRAVEQYPWLHERGPLHHRLIPLLGMPLGELFFLENLAADCAADGVREFLFVSAPLTLHGGAASPANAIAVK